MAVRDKYCTIVPYFKVADGKLEAFKELCEQLVEKTTLEDQCLYYGFSFNGDQAHCRGGYEEAQAVLRHLENVGSLIEEVLKIAEITRFEVHGIASELTKLQEPLANLNPQFFTIEYSFRR